MVFSSLTFLQCFLPLCLLAYFLVPKAWRNGVLFLFSRIPYEWYQKLSLLILFVAVAILALVPLIGIEVGGATRWISLGFTRFQPSEIAKFAVITSFAAIMAAHTRDMKTIRYGVADRKSVV